jgi:hypothetical protein
MFVSIQEENKVDYAMLTRNYASIKFDNGLIISMSREQAEAIVKGFQASKDTEELIALLNQN